MLFQVFPEILEIARLRYDLLSLLLNSSMGRRQIATKLGHTERTIRRECDILRDSGFITYNQDGMHITEKGILAYEYLSDLPFDREKSDLEVKLKSLLSVKEVCIVRGSDASAVGLAASHILRDMASMLSTEKKGEIVLGLTGGSTVEKVVSHFENRQAFPNITVVAARGGVGNRYEYQANTLAEILAGKMGGRHQLLQFQDDLSEEMISRLKKEPIIKTVVSTLSKLNILLFGIGRADVLAKRRSLPKTVVDEVIRGGAVAEAFGHYFDSDGNLVKGLNTIGVTPNKLASIDNAIGVACGEDKAYALIAVSKLSSNLTLVIDEALAYKIIEILENI